jgi:hypothetical protein
MADDYGLLAKWKLAQAASSDARLTRGDLAVLIQILDQMNDGEAWPGLGYIAKAVAIDRSSVVRGVKRLVDLGYLIRKSGNQSKSNRYRMGTPSRCEPAPRRMRAPRSKTAPGVGAGMRLDLGAPVHPEPAYKNPPNTTHGASRPSGLWKDGVRLLMDAGAKEEAARTTIGKLRKTLQDDDAAAEVIAQMLALRPTAPKSYLYAVMRKRGNAPSANAGRLARDTRTDDELASANEEALARLGATA